MKLIPEWRRAWRMFSVQAQAIGVALCATYVQMYDQLKDTFPPIWMASLTACIFSIGLIGRVFKQKSVSGDNDT